MKKCVMLNNIDHCDIKILPLNSYPEIFKRMNVMIFPSEFNEIQKDFPILLAKDVNDNRFVPVAFLGFENKENLYFSSNQWLAKYIPLYFQKGPFLIGFQHQSNFNAGNTSSVVHINLEHPLVNEKNGTPVFNDNGGQTPYLSSITHILNRIKEGDEYSKLMFDELSKLDLISPVELSFEISDNHEIALNNYYSIDDNKLRELDAATLKMLHQKRYLDYAYMMIFSLGNFHSLIERKRETLRNCHND